MSRKLGVRHRIAGAVSVALGFAYLVAYAYILVVVDSIAFDRGDPSYSEEYWRGIGRYLSGL